MRVLLTIISILIIAKISGQVDTISIIDLQQFEQIVENQELEGDLDYDNYYDELAFIADNPYNINSVTPEEFKALNLLSDVQLNSFFEYRNTYGPFISMYELQSIPYWNILTIERMRPFLTLRERILTSGNLSEYLNEGEHLLAFKYKYVFQQRAGFDAERSPNYVGDANHYYLRYRYNYSNKLRWGLTAEKDAGETFFKGQKNYGFDYYSGFFYYHDTRSLIETLAIGDYSLSLGQGLISHNAFGSGKSTATVNVKKSGRAIRPYSSVNETNFLRGIASQIAINAHFKLIGLFSYKQIDGTIRLDTMIEDGFESFSSIIDDGYHRTQSEIAKKNSVKLQTSGASIKYENNLFNIGLNSIVNRFDKPLDHGNQLYNSYRFTGDQLVNTSLDFSLSIKSSNIFGEYAVSNNGGKAFFLSTQTVLHPKVDLVVAYRNYNEKYQAINPNAFGESRNAVNEQGVYIGTAFYISNYLTVRGYFDFWKNPWLKFRVNKPSYGKESILRIEYVKKRKFNIYLQFKNEQNERNSSQENPIREIEKTSINRLRLHFNNQLSSNLELRNRIEYSHFNTNSTTSQGWLLYQDIIYHPLGKKFSFVIRYAVFDTDDFDSRIYAYENDIQFEYRIPFFQQRGTRVYLKTRYKVNRKLTLEARLDRTFLDGVEEIGTAGEVIIGNTRNELKLQAIYKFE